MSLATSMTGESGSLNPLQGSEISRTYLGRHDPLTIGQRGCIPRGTRGTRSGPTNGGAGPMTRPRLEPASSAAPPTRRRRGVDRRSAAARQVAEADVPTPRAAIHPQRPGGGRPVREGIGRARSMATRSSSGDRLPCGKGRSQGRGTTRAGGCVRRRRRERGGLYAGRYLLSRISLTGPRCPTDHES